MKSLVRWASLAVLIGTVIYAFMIYTRNTPDDGVPAAAGTATVAEAAAGLEMGKPIPVDLMIGEALKAQLIGAALDGERALVDQYRDWLLYTAVGAFKPSAKDVADTLFDVPALRQGYMRGLGTFEYGTTRSRDLGGGAILGLIPAKATGAERKDLLAHIADEHRKNLGKAFDRLLVIDYDLDAKAGRATLTRRADVLYDALFSAEYGYREMTVRTVDDLAKFLASADDLTRVSKAGNGGLLVGGRKILGRTYAGITAEHVAAVWQSEKKSSELWAGRNRKIEEKIESLNSAIRLKIKTKSEAEAELERYGDKLDSELAQNRLAARSGFSLDHDVDFNTLIKELKGNTLFVKSFIPDALKEKFDQSIVALEKNNTSFLFQIMKELRGAPDRSAYQIVNRIYETSQYQRARYDGDLQGTEVGMILFYTDLLAKIWAIDFINSAPNATIPGFVTAVASGQRLSPVYAKEADELPSARLWFGTADTGFQVADNGRDVLFARKATRIYSAGSDPLTPGREVQTSASLAAPMEWWNDHYEEVAAYEHEYERLNEIMKWSIVIGWLNERGNSDMLGDLAKVPVVRTHRLGDWVEKQPGLRFKEWKQVQFFPDGHLGNRTEAMAVLVSPAYEARGSFRRLSGGVSLAGRDLFKSRASVPLLRDGPRHSTIDYAASTAEKIVTFEKTAFVRPTGTAQRAFAAVEPRPDIKLRGGASQMAVGRVERVVARGDDVLSVQTKLGDKAVGDLDIARQPNGFSVAWKARDLDTANALAADISRSGNARGTLLGNPRVESVIELDPGAQTFAVRLRGGTDWVILSPEKTPSSDIAKGWLARTAPPDGTMVVQVKTVSQQELTRLVAEQKRPLVLVHDREQPLLRIADGDPPASARSVDIDVGGTILRVQTDPGSGALYLDPGQLSKGYGGDWSALVRQFNRDDIKAIQTAARAQTPTPVKLQRPFTAEQEKAIRDLKAGNVEQVALHAVEDPASLQRVLHIQVLDDVRAADRMAARGELGEALLSIEASIAKFGREPDLLMRRALLHLERRRTMQAAADGAGSLPPMRDPKSFYAELETRLRSAAPEAKQDMAVLRDYVAWNEQAARDLGHPVLFEDGAHVNLGYAAERAPEAVPSSTRIPDNAQVFVADGSGLGSIDWQAGLPKTLNFILMNDMARVVRLPKGSIAQHRPSAIFLPDPATAQATGRKVTVRANPVRGTVSNQQQCNNGSTGNRNCDGDVYIVLPKAA